LVLLADEFWFCPNLLEQQLKKRESWAVTEERELGCYRREVEREGENSEVRTRDSELREIDLGRVILVS
jgi:hypothetical protein